MHAEGVATSPVRVFCHFALCGCEICELSCESWHFKCKLSFAIRESGPFMHAWSFQG